MANKYIRMYRGDTLAFNMEIEGLQSDLDNAYFSCKASYSEESYIFQKTLGDGITMIDTGVYFVRVAPEDTNNIEPGRYYYDLQLCVGEDVYTVLSGVLEIDHDVTRS